MVNSVYENDQVICLKTVIILVFWDVNDLVCTHILNAENR